MQSTEHTATLEAPTPALQAPSAPAKSKSDSSPSLGLGALALAGAGALALGALNASPAQAITPVLTFADIPGTGDIKVLNFALSLEDLETEAYAQALQRLTGGGKGGRDAPPGLSITGLGLNFGQRDASFISRFSRFSRFSRVEREHRDFLRGALGSAAIRPFNYRFGIESMTRVQVVTLIHTLEMGGVGAYLGAIPSFRTKTYLPVAAAILGTEARHTAIIANILNGLSGREVVPVAPKANMNQGRDVPVSPDATLAFVSSFIVRPTTA